jgi:SAM-dependent methyltransferase/uncharacterized protein YbaR (Trm112 family)
MHTARLCAGRTGYDCKGFRDRNHREHAGRENGRHDIACELRCPDTESDRQYHATLLPDCADRGLIHLRFELFESLSPVCPHCRQALQQDHSLKLTKTINENEHGLIEGILNCSNSACQLEYPVIDGIPIIVPNIRNYISENLAHITARSDLSGLIESILGDSVGAGTHFDATRQHLSTYAWDHYGDVSSGAFNTGRPGSSTPGSIVSLLNAALNLVEPGDQSPMIDLGCSVGRIAFELAEKFEQPVLGVDINFSMLRLAQRIVRQETCSFPFRRLGLVYDQLTPETNFRNSRRVDFWACDALALPFPGETFGFATAFNVFDSVHSPYDLLVSIEKCLRPSGTSVLACPYDWSPGATPMESWIGGHSQRGELHGAAEPFLRNLLTPGAHPMSIANLEWVAEIEGFEWNLRVHDRSRTVYNTHLVGLRKGSPAK